MAEPVIQRTFAGGELAPVHHARADLAKYQQGAKTVKNFVVRKEGGVSNRAGTRFVEACKTTDAGTRLMRFTMSVTGFDILIEVGAGYFRFYASGERLEVSGVPAWSAVTNYVPGDLVSVAGVNYYAHTASLNQTPPNGSFWHALTGAIYEIPTPYALDDVFKWTQSGNVIDITHNDHVPRELVFVSTTRWVLQTVSTIPTIGPPGGTSGSAGAAGARTFAYVVTTAKAETYEESNPSAVITIVAAADPTEDAPHVLTWTAVTGAVEYYVYGDPYENGVFGFLGVAASTTFNDTGFIPDFSSTPPIPRNLFTSPGGFPATAARFQQRRFYANLSFAEGDAVYGSRSGFPANFGISSPLQDDDAVTFKVAGNNAHAVRYLIALKDGLILLTDGGEWTVTGGSGAKSPITPTSIDTEQETYVGIADDVRPAVIGNTILYLQARGTVMRELRFDQEVEGLAGKDLSIFASHLTGRGKTIVAMDYGQVPDSVIWCVRSDGRLLGLTYIPEEEVWGWHRHESLSNLPGETTATLGVFEDVCVVSEADEDIAYFIVARTIGGSTVRYIERLESRQIRDGFFATDAFFVDCGLSYSGVPANVFSGLDHLEGQIVAVLGDGAVVFNGDPTSALAASFTVTGGTITLTADVSVAHIGLPIRYADLELLDLDTAGSSVRDKKKRVVAVTLLVEHSARSFWIGPDTGSLTQYDQQLFEPAGFAFSGQLELTPTAMFTETGRVFIRQIDPLPITVLGVIPSVDLGG